MSVKAFLHSKNSRANSLEDSHGSIDSKVSSFKLPESKDHSEKNSLRVSNTLKAKKVSLNVPSSSSKRKKVYKTDSKAIEIELVADKSQKG